MRRLALITAVLALGACTPDNPPDVPEMERIGRDDFMNDVSKICDNGRAVYVMDARNGRDAMVVVSDAPECAQ